MEHLQVNDKSYLVHYANELDANGSSATSLLDDTDPDQITSPAPDLSPSVRLWPL